ncbi:MAG TPA: AraC family transcriptional regulator, partial [Spirochaetes bacterium]|nr:AraC family transcriptional regulator [Spirochaetota bacterium]
LHIAYYIENIKKGKQDTARVILEKQDMVIDRVSRGDIPGAKEIVNEFLGCIFFDSGMNFDMLKIRVMELVVILSRKAIEHGVRARELLGLNYSSLTELNGTTGFEELCHSLTRILEKYIESLGSLKRRRKSFECRVMRAYIEEHFSERVTAEDVAAAAGLSASRALHLFKEETGMSFTEHLRKARVEFAKYMLIDSDHSIAEIAMEAGFADQSHFTRQFREVEKTTPRRFRVENR